MLESIVSFSIKNKFIVAMATLALIVYGSYSVTQLPIDAVPDITNTQVQVITLSPSLAAPEVERLAGVEFITVIGGIRSWHEEVSER